MALTVRVFRFDPAKDESPYYASYSLPEGGVSVLAALRYIYECLDPTLGFRNYYCNCEVCRSCEVRLNGRVTKGCVTILEDGQEYVIEPTVRQAVIRDLVVDLDRERDPRDNSATIVSDGKEEEENN